LDENSLIRLAAQQDQQAWADLVHEHQEAVFRLAYLFLGDSDDAQDITQEAFIRTFRAIDQADPARPFRAWVLSITANLAKNRLRSVGRYLSALARFARREPEAVMPTPAPADPNGDAQNLWENVRQLNLDDQQIIYLRFFLELSEEETRAALKIPVGTAKSRLHRALKKLRARLELKGDAGIDSDGETRRE
jgi:RNA polymerase sigma-70 factor (ECF subfamily)